MHLWRADYGPFIRWAQLKFCRRLIVVPLSTFHRLAEQIGDPEGELIFLFNTARCGSTLLTQVLFLRNMETPQHSLANCDSCPTPAKTGAIEYLQVGPTEIRYSIARTIFVYL